MADIVEKDVLVVGGEHYNTLGLIRSLGERGIGINLVLTVKGKSHIAKSKYIKNIWQTSIDEKSILETINLISEKYKGKLVVFPTSDQVMQILDENYNFLSRKFIIPNIRQLEGKITQLMNKENMNSVATKAGLNIPQSLMIDLPAKKQYTEDYISSKLSYPIILKPLDSNSGKKEDIVVCNAYNKFKSSIDELSDRYNKVLAQEYIHGPDQLMIEIIGCSSNDGTSIVIPGVIEKIREYPMNAGSTSYAKIVRESKFIDINLVESFIKKIGYNGIFDVEFKYANEKAYFIEINFRNGAPGYAVTKAGVNIPYIWLNDNNSQDVSEPTKIIKDIYLMSELRDIRHVINKEVKLSRWVRDICKTDAFLYFNKKDIKPFISKVLR